jgi:transposase
MINSTSHREFQHSVIPGIGSVDSLSETTHNTNPRRTQINKTYIGLDVSLKETSICIVDRDGVVIKEGSVLSDPDAITDFIRAHTTRVDRVGLETGPTASWLWRELKARELPVVCIDARHAEAALSMQINKSDRNDALGIARVMQTGWYREV